MQADSQLYDSPSHEQVSRTNLVEFRLGLEVFLKDDNSGLNNSNYITTYQFFNNLCYRSQTFHRLHSDLTEYNRRVEGKTVKEVDYNQSMAGPTVAEANIKEIVREQEELSNKLKVIRNHKET